MSERADETSSLTEHERELLHDAFDDAPFEFWVRDLDGRCIILNKATKGLGVRVGQRVEEAQVPADVIASWQDNNRRAFAGEVVQNEFEYGSGDAKRYLQCYIVPLRIRGAIRGVLGFNIDVTHHRRTELALRESEHRLRGAMQVARMGWLDWDLVTNEMRWSPETYRLFGYEPGNGFSPTIGLTVGMVPPEDLPHVSGGIAALIDGTAPYDIVHRVVRGDGRTIHIHAQGEVMRDDQGKALRMLGTVVDVTERMRVEEELREVDRRRSEFIGVLSHELRNPLAVIATSVRSIDRASPSQDKSDRVITAVQRQTQHLSRLVDDLLDNTRVRSGKISLNRSRIDLTRLVRDTVEDHRGLLAHLEVKTSVPEAPTWTRCDSTRIAQVLGNVISNAAKFTSAGGSISIALALTSPRDAAVIEVTDTGVGMDDETLLRLFTPSVQATRSVDRTRVGLGLGLALVKTLVELHGGDVRAHSGGPGQGTTVTITLPLVEAETVEPLPVPRSTSRTPRNVLLIEDDPDVAEWLAEALTFSGHHVVISLDAVEGISKARELGPDVILCDIGLPGTVDGYEVARRLRTDAALGTVFRVALTGYAQPEDQTRAREAGFDAHLSKPPDLDALERLLADLPRRAP